MRVSALCFLVAIIYRFQIGFAGIFLVLHAVLSLLRQVRSQKLMLWNRRGNFRVSRLQLDGINVLGNHELLSCGFLSVT